MENEIIMMNHITPICMGISRVMIIQMFACSVFYTHGGHSFKAYAWVMLFQY